MNKIKVIINNPILYVFSKMELFHVWNKMSDEKYLKIKYLIKMKRKLNLDAPILFNEKMQWLKIYDKKDIYTSLVDKYAVKNYVKEIIGEEYIIPTLGIWESFEEIDFEQLPEQFVLKCTHDSGGIWICRKKSELDIKKVKEKICKSMNTNFYFTGREWPYKNVKPRIIAEQYMEEESATELKDYKIFCFDGKPKIIQLDYDRFSDHHRNMYDINWNRLPFDLKYVSDEKKKFSAPSNLAQMLEFASKLSKNIPFVRVDFYSISGSTYFGEMTFYPESGFGEFSEERWNKKLGEWLVL